MQNARESMTKKDHKPRRSWKDGITEAMEFTGLAEADWEDRVQWRMDGATKTNIYILFSFV